MANNQSLISSFIGLLRGNLTNITLSEVDSLGSRFDLNQNQTDMIKSFLISLKNSTGFI